MRGLFVSGTDTGVGKTVLSAALLAAMAVAGEHVRAYKPVVTGLDEPESSWPPDHELLAEIACMTPTDVSPLRFGPAASPHLAAQMASASVDPHELVAGARRAAAGGELLVVEGVGGMLVPLTGDYLVRDLAVALGLPLVVAARPGLGTINHTLLTVAAARAAGLEVAAVVLTPWPEEPDAIERSNRETIARLTRVDVATLARVGAPTAAALARAGESLDWRAWVA